MTVDRAFGVSLEDRGIPRRMIIISLLFHIFVLSLFLLSPKTPSPKLTFGPDYAVNLVSAADLHTDSGSSSKSPSQAVKEPPAPTKEVSEAVPLPSTPVRKVEPVKKAEGTVGKAIEEIRRRVEAASQKPSSSAYSNRGKAVEEIRRRVEAASQKQSDAPVSGIASGAVSSAELGARMKSYYGSIWTRIKRRWSMPPDLLPRENIEVVIHVRILRSGAVEGISFEKRSGNSYFDESAMRAVRKASPFPPLPEGMGDGGIEMGIRFHPSELQ